MIRALQRIYQSLYRVVMGHYPFGTLVVYDPKPGLKGFVWREKGDPDIGSIGIVVGGWAVDKSPGFTMWGSIVVIGGVQHRLANQELEVIDAAG